MRWLHLANVAASWKPPGGITFRVLMDPPAQSVAVVVMAPYIGTTIEFAPTTQAHELLGHLDQVAASLLRGAAVTRADVRSPFGRVLDAAGEAFAAALPAPRKKRKPIDCGCDCPGGTCAP